MNQRSANRRRMPLGVLAIIPIIAVFALYAFTGQRQVPPAVTLMPRESATPTAPAIAEPTLPAPLSPPAAEPTPWSPPFADPPVPMPAPIMARGALHDGAWVRVNAGAGDCLNARSGPVVATEYVIVNECLPDGYEGYLVGPATENDGHWWWRIAGAGYVVEDYLTYLREGDLRLPPSARGDMSLGGADGSIAFLREDGIWIMEADGSEQRRIAPLPVITSDYGDYKYTTYPTDLSWSPDGTMLSYNLAGREPTDGGEWPVDLNIIRTDGSVVRVMPGMAGRGWSPDGTRIGVVIGATQQQMRGGWKGVPAWIDVATGDVRRLDAGEFYQQDPPAFNYDGTLLLITRGEEETAADGSVSFVQSFVVVDAANNVVARVASPKDGFYGSPTWSPVADRIAFYEGNPLDPAYAVYDLAAGGIVARTSLSEPNPNAGGRCGGGDMFRTSWSADGTTLYYAEMDRIPGENGVRAWEIAPATTTLIAAPYVIAPSAGPDGRVVFGSDGFVFIGDGATARRTLVTDGQMPVWSR